jgi:hypothetical protein
MTLLHSTSTRSNPRRVRMNPGTPWWNASERLREVLEQTIGLTHLRVERHFHSLTATYEAIRDEGVPADTSRATASIPIRLNGRVIGDVLVQDRRRTAYDEQARASAAQIVDAFAAGFEDPSAVVRATTSQKGEA